MPSALILTGTCGSGKTTISKLLARDFGWRRIAEDDIWKLHFGKNRGPFRSEEHRLKRMRVHEKVFAETLVAYQTNHQVVIDATVHEAPPDSYQEYRLFFEGHSIPWRICVLHPRLEVAIARDSQRSEWVAGDERVRLLRAKFTTEIFGHECFIDNSDETPEHTTSKILQFVAA
jgi:dephospho-CoA kinase